jgi:hypothetical protein
LRKSFLSRWSSVVHRKRKDFLYVIGSATDILIGADITSATMPGANVNLQTVASLSVPKFTNASYPLYQDNFGYIHNRKIDMTSTTPSEPVADSAARSWSEREPRQTNCMRAASTSRKLKPTFAAILMVRPWCVQTEGNTRAHALTAMLGLKIRPPLHT